MIIDVWRPKTKSINKKQVIQKYEKFNLNDLSYDSPGTLRIVYKCDGENCKYPDKVYSIDFSHWRSGKKGKGCSKNTLERQLCKSCTTSGENNVMYGKTHTDEVKEILRESMNNLTKKMKEEYGVDNVSYLDWIKEKKNQVIINDDTAKELCDNSGLEFISLKGNNKSSILTVKCKNGHIFKRRWMNLRKGITGCRECFYDRLRQEGVRHLKSAKRYYARVWQFTKITVRKYPDMIKDLEKRGREWHLDHKFSVVEGFKQNIPPYIIGSYHNLEIIDAIENMRKQGNCSINKNELFENFFKEDYIWN